MKADATFSHTPVMLEQVMNLLEPRDGGLYCDGTAGRGGHSQELLERSGPTGRLIAIDRDPTAVATVRKRLAAYGERVEVVHGRFSDVGRLLEERNLGRLDGFLLDLGVSSPQLDDGARGFSFQKAGPIDMRLDPTSGESAHDAIERLAEGDLARVLKELGEERRARSVARAIKRALSTGELKTTLDLARVIRRAVGQPRSGRIDAATRSFQALRIHVNEELRELDVVLDELPDLLAEEGRAAFLSFHSLEDRAVKHGLRHWANCRCAPRSPQCICGGSLLKVLTKKPVIADDDEIERNPRSRSAKLRAAMRLQVVKAEEATCA